MKAICTICSRPDRSVIDAALISGAKIQKTGEAFGVSRFIVSRHRKSHIVELRVKKDPKKAREDASLVAEIIELQAKTASLIAKAERSGDLKTMLAAVELQKELIQLKADPTKLTKQPKRGGKAGRGEKPATEGFRYGQQLEGLIDRQRLCGVKRGGKNATLPASA